MKGINIALILSQEKEMKWYTGETVQNYIPEKCMLQEVKYRL